MRTQKGEKKRKNEMNSNANIVELMRGLNICLADGRQPTTVNEEKMCIYRMDSITNISIYKREMRDTSFSPILSLHIVSSLKENSTYLFSFSILFTHQR